MIQPTIIFQMSLLAALIPNVINKPYPHDSNMSYNNPNYYNPVAQPAGVYGAPQTQFSAMQQAAQAQNQLLSQMQPGVSLIPQQHALGAQIPTVNMGTSAYLSGHGVQTGAMLPTLPQGVPVNGLMPAHQQVIPGNNVVLSAPVPNLSQSVFPAASHGGVHPTGGVYPTVQYGATNPLYPRYQ